MSSLGDRMKRYENHYRQKVLPRMPCILRLDGKAFHSLTKGCNKPFDNGFMDSMDEAAAYVMDTVQNARLCYVQSDEISVVLVDYNTYQSQPWFDGNVQKMVSVSASAATFGFMEHGWSDAPGLFDARVFVVPKEEVVNYFIWRQQDCIRNAIQMVARSAFSHTECHKKNCDQLQEMLFQEKGINFKEDFSNYERRGRCFMRFKGPPQLDRPQGMRNVEALFDIPDFTKEREFIERYLQIEEE